MKSKSEMMKRLYNERKAKGLVLFKEWMTEEQRKRVHEYLVSIRKDR